MMTTKERLIACYVGHGFSETDAHEYATSFLEELRRQPPGIEWTLGPNAKGESVIVRRDQC